MKKNIHPKYHKIKVEMTDGSQFETRSTCFSNAAHNLEVMSLDLPDYQEYHSDCDIEQFLITNKVICSSLNDQP